jgi:hypothetical protein
MRAVRQRIFVAHLTVCRGIIDQLEQVQIDAFPTASVAGMHRSRLLLELLLCWPENNTQLGDLHSIVLETATARSCRSCPNGRHHGVVSARAC